MNILRKLFDHEYKELKKFSALADKIEALNEEYQNLKDEELKAKTDEFKKMFAEYLTEEFKPKIKRKINTSMERLLDAHCEIPENSLEINDEYEFSCAAYL